MRVSFSRTDIDIRFLEVRTLLSSIKSQESTATPPIDSDDVKIIRGLFYVHLYGTFEKSVNEIVMYALREIDVLNIKNFHAAVDFLPVALASIFQALQAPTNDSKWKKRVEFVKTMQSSTACKISDSVFGDQLQNVSPDRLQEIITYLCLPSPFSESDLLPIGEIVEKRNQVAHGRTSPLRVGSSVKSTELESRLITTISVIDRLIVCIESGLDSRHFVSPSFLAEYSHH
jgi:hypothetical protein